MALPETWDFQLSTALVGHSFSYSTSTHAHQSRKLTYSIPPVQGFAVFLVKGYTTESDNKTELYIEISMRSTRCDLPVNDVKVWF